MKKITALALLFLAASANAQTAAKFYPVAGDVKLISGGYVLPMSELLQGAKGKIKITAFLDEKGLYISPMPEDLEDAADFTLSPFMKDGGVWFRLNLKYKDTDFEKIYRFLKFKKEGALLSSGAVRCAVSKDGAFNISDVSDNKNLTAQNIKPAKQINLNIPPLKPLPETLNMQLSFFFDDKGKKH
ncbi:MAG: hypothetical protein LBI01_03295 [Elusimicrobium sp.]|jgi:hypothetical protein|nr:hypothetical protein [Elusimicrobium sp.]